MARVNLDEETEADDDDIAWGDEGEPDEEGDGETTPWPTNEQMAIIDDALSQATDADKAKWEESGERLREATDRARRVREELDLDAAATGNLSPFETQQFEQLEQTIEGGLKTFVDVGTALMVVRDRKLYRVDYQTFDLYCRGRWDMGRSRVYQMIDAAMVVDNLKMSTIVDILPENEAQARPLTQLEPEQQAEAWKEAQAAAPDGKPTAKQVQEAVYKRQPSKPTPKLAQPTYFSPEPKEKERVVMTLRAPDGSVIASTVDNQPQPPDGFVNDLIHAHMDSETFRFALRSATMEQLDAALGHISPETKRDRFLRVGNRRELLQMAKDAQLVDEVIEASMPIVASDGPKLSHQDAVMRDIELYEQEAKAEVAQWREEEAQAQPVPTTPAQVATDPAPMRSGLVEVLATDTSPILLDRAIDDATVTELDAAIAQLRDKRGAVARQRIDLYRIVRREKAKQPPIDAVRVMVNFCERSQGKPALLEATGELRQWLDKVTT